MDAWKQNVYFILVEPGEPGNIGASARAIKNMGFTKLCLIKPSAEMTDEGRWFARNAHDVLNAAAVYDSVGAAIQDKALVVGTTRRIGRRRGVILPPEKGAARICTAALNNKVALLFGRETRGLYNDEIGECGFMIRIASSEIQPSLNLAQAVLIIAYELARHAQEIEAADRSIRKRKYDNTVLIEGLKSHGEIASLFGRISGLLELLEYVPRGDRNLMDNIMTTLKHFIGRSGITEKELNMLQGICTQIEKKVGRKKDDRAGTTD